jgi:type IV pilus modification protein PilV
MRVRASAVGGFMLMEVLVSLFLVALGVGAWLNSQAGALRQTRLNHHRAMAILLATDMADRLRASPQTAASMAFEQGFGAQSPLNLSRCSIGTCDAPAWAAADAAQWRQWVRQALPQGLSLVRVDAAARQATVTVAWHEPGAQALGHEAPTLFQCPAQLALPAGEAVRCLSLGVAW